MFASPARARAGVARAAPAPLAVARAPVARSRTPRRPTPVVRAQPRGALLLGDPARRRSLRAALASRRARVVRTRGDLAPRRADANAVVLAPTASADDDDDDDDDDAVSAIDDHPPPSDSDSDAPSGGDTSDIFAQLVKFTLPTMAIWMCGPILSMVDTAVVGTASTLELAAMSPGSVFVDYPCYIVCTSLAVATTTLVAQDRIAREKKRRAAADAGGGGGDDTVDIPPGDATVADGVAIAFAAGALVAAALFFVAAPVIAAFAGPASAAVVPPAMAYALVRCAGIPAALVTSVAQASFLACRSPWQPLASVGAAGAVNLVADVVLVVLMGHGIRGAALATVGSQIVMAGVLVHALLKEGRRRRAWLIEKRGLKAVVDAEREPEAPEAFEEGFEGFEGDPARASAEDVTCTYAPGRAPVCTLSASYDEDDDRSAAAAAAAAAAAQSVKGPATTRETTSPDSSDACFTLPALARVPTAPPPLRTTARFLTIAGPVCFLNAIKVVFVGSLMQAVTAISPECSAANGVMSAIYFFFGVMGDGVSQAAQTFLPPVLGTERASQTATTLLLGALALGLVSAFLASGVAVGAPGVFTNSAAVADLMRLAAPTMALALVLNTASMGSEGCLLAARDLAFMAWLYPPNAAAAYWTLTKCLSAEGIFGWGSLGAASLWVALAQFHAVRLVANAGRLAFGSPRRGSPLRRKLNQAEA